MEKKYQAADRLFYSLRNDEDNNFITGFTQGVDWSIDKACKWLNMLADGFIIKDSIAGIIYDKNELVDDFRKAMEE